jgi:hypothetical protein
MILEYGTDLAAVERTQDLGSLPRLAPLMITSPAEHGSSARMRSSKVLLTEPECPVRNTISPLLISKLTLVSASRPYG